MATSSTLESRIGLAHWMERVLGLCAEAQTNFSAESVHDLRTALRRSRSLAEGIRCFDPDPAWKKMRRAARSLFGSLGELRDTQVMMEWVVELAPEGDLTRKNLAEFLLHRERDAKRTAAAALGEFDRKQWRTWTEKLPGRAARIPLDGRVFAHLALERWLDARRFHMRALRNRTHVALHDLRKAIKRFRYTVENFLPQLDQAWGENLKGVQDVLGEVHDLHVLWRTALALGAFPDMAERDRWRERFVEEHGKRIRAYREKMVGKNTLWHLWRAELPEFDECRALGFERLEIWSSYLDPNVTHSMRVAQLALQLFDGLPAEEMGIRVGPERDTQRWILRAAAIMHEVGRAKANSGHHKASARLVNKLEAPLGWTADELRIAALALRYHRGALPRDTQKGFAALSEPLRLVVQFLGGILRLACACDPAEVNRIRGIAVEALDPVITLRATGYVESTPLAEHIAAARHLLELTFQRPVFVLAGGEKAQAHAA
ncbi:MAG: CHAD domain-containing protein [Acidobacteria bacterium]|nr:CHAD domain-containing protein [Acidobacteriota bacterium]